jgi:GTP-binding protein EngB required for normal cell division
MSENKALKLAERAVELGEDLDESKEALKAVKTFEESRISQIKNVLTQQKIDKENEAKQKLESVKTLIDTSEEIIPGVKFNSRTKSKVFDSMTAIEEYTSNGAPINSFLKRMSEDDDFRVKVHYLDIITDGFTKWDKIKRAEKSKAIKDLEQAVDQERLKSSNKTVTPEKQKSSVDKLFNAFNF